MIVHKVDSRQEVFVSPERFTVVRKDIRSLSKRENRVENRLGEPRAQITYFRRWGARPALARLIRVTRGRTHTGNHGFARTTSLVGARPALARLTRFTRGRTHTGNHGFAWITRLVGARFALARLTHVTRGRTHTGNHGFARTTSLVGARSALARLTRFTRGRTHTGNHGFAWITVVRLRRRLRLGFDQYTH
jgi:hypothetical protein